MVEKIKGRKYASCPECIVAQWIYVLNSLIMSHYGLGHSASDPKKKKKKRKRKPSRRQTLVQDKPVLCGEMF